MLPITSSVCLQILVSSFLRVPLVRSTICLVHLVCTISHIMFPTNYIVPQCLPPSSSPLCFHGCLLISANALRSLILHADDPHIRPLAPKVRPQHLHRSRQLRPSLHARRLRIRYVGALGRAIRHHHSLLTDFVRFEFCNIRLVRGTEAFPSCVLAGPTSGKRLDSIYGSTQTLAQFAFDTYCYAPSI